MGIQQRNNTPLISVIIPYFNSKETGINLQTICQIFASKLVLYLTL